VTGLYQQGYSKSPYNSSSKPDPTFPYELFEKIYGPKEGELLPTSAAAAAATVVPITPAAPADASVDAKVQTNARRSLHSLHASVSSSLSLDSLLTKKSSPSAVRERPRKHPINQETPRAYPATATPREPSSRRPAAWCVCRWRR